MAIRFRQFRLLLWKNFILQKRRPIGTTFEILVPVALISILILPKLMMNRDERINCFSTYEPDSMSSLQQGLQQSLRNYYYDYDRSVKEPNASRPEKKVLAYYPVGNPVASLMQRVSNITGVKVVNRSAIYKDKEFTNLDEVVDEVTEHDNFYLGVIIFDVENKKPLPNKVKYTIRLPHSWWETDRTYPRWQSVGPNTYTIYKRQFIPLQYAIDMAIIQEKSGTSPIPLDLQQFPYPSYKREDDFSKTILKIFLPFLITLAFLYSAISIIKEIVFEKQNRLKESMKMMGLANWVHWLAWYIKCLLFLMISIVIITVIIKVMNIFEFSNAFIVLLFFIFYAMSSISYCFFISVFFSNPKMSMLFGCVLWYAAFLPYQVLSFQDKYDKSSIAAKAAMCLLPNSAVGVGATLFARLESIKVGVTFDNINEPTSSDDTFTMASVMGMMIVSSIVYMILTWYIEGIFPGKYGIPKPFYFPFQRSYWCGFSNIQIESIDENETEKNHGVEDEPTDLEVGVGIKNLRKVFKGSAGSKVAVDGLTLNMFKGQITALLGHNGAGKTTTMSILCGLFPPSSGTAHIGKKSIQTDIDAIRESLGLCPQHNVLFDRLTVKEHLEFFINLKGKYGQAAKEEVVSMITDMQLLDKINDRSSTLSGGMKRKLSCAIALVGGSEIVFLDEPTSGMDPFARRATWDLLLKYKAGKTIILTTHFMDEADFLGDRIAIMADGQLRCCGSSLFLKSRYGVGYHLTIVKKENFDENITINAIKRFVPSAEVLSNVGAELELVLNREAANSFETLFLELETKREEYGIASFGVSVTTMEEVFMKVGEGSEKTVEDIVHKDADNMVEMLINNEEPQIGELLKGFHLKWQQYKAMFMKRFLNSKRDKKAVVTQLILPLVMVLFGLLIMSAKPTEENNPPRLLTLSKLSSGERNVKAFYADFNQSGTKKFTVVKDYLKTFRVDTLDITDNVLSIASGNANNSIAVKASTYTYGGSNNDQSNPCCHYQFLILNHKCRSIFLNKSLTVEKCSTNDKFGYKYCPQCLLSSSFNYWRCPVGINQAVPNNKNIYFNEYVLEQSNAKDYFNKHVAGFTFAPHYKIQSTNVSNTSVLTKKTSTNTTLWYSNQALHTIAEVMNAMSNIFLHQELGNSNNDIETTNFPLPKSAKRKLRERQQGSIFDSFFMALFLSMGMSFMAASFITFLVYEKSCKAKHLQFVSGVDSFCYWFATYTWDYMNYLITAVCVLILIAAFQIEEFKDDLGPIFLLLLLFGLCALPFIYSLSFLFTSPLTAYVMTFFILSVFSLGMLIAVIVTRFSEKDKSVAEIMHYVFLLFPTYALSISINDMSTNYQRRKACTKSSESSRTCAKNEYTPNALDWDMPGVGQEALFMFVEAIVLFLFTLFLQKNILTRASKAFQHSSQTRRSEDQDVSAERTRVENLTKDQIRDEAVVIKDLTKVYRGKNSAAVDHLSLGIPKGECFGLLGVNGAGKTTTFSMLTGDLNITDGAAYLDGYNLQSQLRQVQQRIGYCPQFDALIERMTGREMLTMYARLRGVHSSKISDIVSATIENMNLGKWADKLCGNYSGGNKRKLSTGIALVGNPPIVFLDEPTTGLDPVARRFLWDTLSNVLRGGRSIVLTSHSMEECDALCSRLAIMVNGQFKCIGSPQHLKSRFGKGYTLMIKVKANNDNETVQPVAQNGEVQFQPVAQGSANPQQLCLGVEHAAISKAKSFVEQAFQGATLMESHSGMMTYQIINESLTWSQIFGHLERNRQMLDIVDYSVSQTTLEQVFINFAKEQHSEDRTKVKRKCGCLPCC